MDLTITLQGVGFSRGTRVLLALELSRRKLDEFSAGYIEFSKTTYSSIGIGRYLEM